MYSSSIDRFYKGQTNNLEDRLLRHNSGFEKSYTGSFDWFYEKVS
ncbi:MAG: hypothetical protein U9N53_14560 [Bacteroidota bacterium]|nr:hypothetical protein [Bacteroidota bacterium]